MSLKVSLLGIIFTRHSRPFRTRVTNLRENKVVQFSQKPKSFWVYSFIPFFAFHDYHYFDPILRASGRLPNYNEKIVQILHVYAFPKKSAQNAQWAILMRKKVHLKETARHNLPQKLKQYAFCNCFECNSTKVFIVLFFHF